MDCDTDTATQMKEFSRSNQCIKADGEFANVVTYRHLQLKLLTQNTRSILTCIEATDKHHDLTVALAKRHNIKRNKA